MQLVCNIIALTFSRRSYEQLLADLSAVLGAALLVDASLRIAELKVVCDFTVG